MFPENRILQKRSTSGSLAPQGTNISAERVHFEHSMQSEAFAAQVPETVHPNPSSKGMMLLPERPNFLSTKSDTKANSAKKPLSSR